MVEYGTTTTGRNEGAAPQNNEEVTALASNIAAQAVKAAVESMGFTQSGYQAALSGQPLTATQAQQAQRAQSQQAGQVQARKQAGQQAQSAQTKQASQLQTRQQSSQQSPPSLAPQADSPQLSAFTQQQDQARSQQQHSPAVDVIEAPDEVLILADLPGVDSDSIDVRANDSTISLSAERISSHEGDQRGIPVMSERGKVMQRQIQLPAKCNVNDASASWDHGVVEITLPKTESESQEEIGVQ